VCVCRDSGNDRVGLETKTKGEGGPNNLLTNMSALKKTRPKRGRQKREKKQAVMTLRHVKRKKGVEAKTRGHQETGLCEGGLWGAVAAVENMPRLRQWGAGGCGDSIFGKHERRVKH